MAELIYSMCALTAIGCAWLALRGYRQSRYRLLFWTGLCFLGLSVNNILLVLDKLVFPEIDLSLFRQLFALASVLLLLFGLIWEEE
ncbi:MAG: rane protein [Polaromonas sp.]|nr:rane protein [Polaromonas sp.]